MTIKDFMKGNTDAGQFFFSKDTMSFFNSRIIENSWNGDGYFITGERFEKTAEYPEKFTIRRGDTETFKVSSDTGFQKFDTLADARRELRELRKTAEVAVPA